MGNGDLGFLSLSMEFIKQYVYVLWYMMRTLLIFWILSFLLYFIIRMGSGSSNFQTGKTPLL